jgi:hypothetical protein
MSRYYMSIQHNDLNPLISLFPTTTYVKSTVMVRRTRTVSVRVCMARILGNSSWFMGPYPCGLWSTLIHVARIGVDPSNPKCGFGGLDMDFWIGSTSLRNSYSL